ncbi:MAG: hypothetical protein JO167_07950, partial [Alphaproteobacteria bacterium]|nr:hypothetical protein [Alphaproteobacteria bacterium]
MSVALAVTVHDPEGVQAVAIERLADTLRGLFAGFALNISDRTDARVGAVAERVLGAKTMRHLQGEPFIGRARRGSVEMALTCDAAQVLYCDLDHLLRWVEADAGEVRAVLSRGLDADMLVIGRSARTFAAEPKRLQDTERVVNHIYALMTGHEGFDVMFAARRLSRRAAEMIVREAREDTVGNDVEWPLLVERAGLSVA